MDQPQNLNNRVEADGDSERKGPSVLKQRIRERVRRRGYDFIDAADMRRELEWPGVADEWKKLEKSWDRLPEDTYMADGGRYRRRRHSVFHVDRQGRFQMQPRQPHYQSRDRNRLNGGIQRWFEPIEPQFATGAVMSAILRFGHVMLGQLAPHVGSWRVEAHQFRILASQGEAGRPTPEGMHRDGVNYALVMMIGRRNVASGVTRIADLEGRSLGAFMLKQPFDAVFVDDERVYHGVTPIVPEKKGGRGHRDVLVVTWTLSKEG